MAMTLTETAALTKKMFIFGVVAIFAIILAWFIFNFLQTKEVAEIPIIEETADTKFNLLPKPKFNASLENTSKYSYELLTKTGQLPTDLPKLIKVYFVSKLGTTLLAPNRAKELAGSFNFNRGPFILTATIYKFTDESGGDITIDLDTGNFKFSRKESTESGELQEEIIPDQGKIVEDFKSFLQEKDLLYDDLSSGRSKVGFDQQNQKEATRAYASIWQDDIKISEEVIYPIVTENYTEGLVKAEISKYPDEQNKYLGLNYTYWPIDFTNFATYPLKDIAQAFEELKSGKATLVLEPTQTQVSITDVYLAYLLTEKYSKYMQPVFVFEGDSFASYVSAIPDEYFEKANN